MSTASAVDSFPASGDALALPPKLIAALGETPPGERNICAEYLALIPAPANELWASPDAGDYRRFYSCRANAMRYTGRKCERRPFVALDSPERFVVAHVDWEYPAPHELCRGDNFPDEADKETMHSARWLLTEQLDAPASLLAVLPFQAGMSEFTIDETDRPVTREDGIKAVLAFNTDSNYDKCGLRWAVLVELGQDLCDLASVQFDANGIGTYERTEHRPIRLVRFTEAEQAEHAIGWEGGDDA